MATSPDTVSYSTSVVGISTWSSRNTYTATGTTQDDAWPITNDIAVFTTVDANTGAILWDADVVVINRGSNTLSVYPPVGAQIESYGTNVAAPVYAGGAAHFIRISASQYYAV